MNILFSIEHPAHAYQFGYLIKKLISDGHRLKVVIVKKDSNNLVLDHLSIPYTIVAKGTGSNMLDKALLFIGITIKTFFIFWSFKPDYVVGRATPMVAINAFLFRKKHLVFEDTERCRICNFCSKLFSYKIITPMLFTQDLGKKQVRMAAYKELFYLSTNYFKADLTVLPLVGLLETDTFIVVRFVAWNASHDIGYSGFSGKEKVELVRRLEKFGKVLISSENELPLELKENELKIPFHQMHSLLYFASLYFGEGASMASEAAVLGTHAIYINPLTAGSLNEQEHKFNLVFNFSDEHRKEKSLEKAVQILSDKDNKQKAKKKALYLESQCVDINEYFLKEIEKG